MFKIATVISFLLIGNCMGQLETIINSIEDKHLKDMRLVLIDESMLNALIERQSVLVIKKHSGEVFHSELKVNGLGWGPLSLSTYLRVDWMPDPKLNEYEYQLFGGGTGLYVVFKRDRIQRWPADHVRTYDQVYEAGDCIYYVVGERGHFYRFEWLNPEGETLN